MKKNTKEVIDPELAKQLKEGREKKGLTQAQAAKLAEVTETFFAMTERGESNPSFAKLDRMFQAVGLKLAIKRK